MNLLQRYERLVEDMRSGSYYRRLYMAPAPHRFRTQPRLALHQRNSDIRAEQTIAMPTFNHERCIRETLTCLLASISAPSEVIIIDDSSTDSTIEVITSFLRSISNPCLVEAIVLRNEVPIYETACDNVCFTLASAPCIIEVQADIFIRHHRFDREFSRALEKGASAVSGRCGHAFNLIRGPRSRMKSRLARQVRRLLGFHMAVGLAGEEVMTGDISSWIGRTYSCETVNRGPWALLKSDLERFGYLDERHFFLGNDDHDFHRRVYAAERRSPCYIPIWMNSPLEHGASRQLRRGMNKLVYDDLALTRRGSPEFDAFLSSHVSWRPVTALSG